MKKNINEYHNWVRSEELVTDLFLDPNNIRLEVVKKTQDALITDLFSNEDAMQIFESIVENGFFPDERPVVVKENNKLVVVEGNRRVAALKVMLNPDLLGFQKNKVEKFLSQINVIKKVEVLIAPNRDSVNKLLAIKHTKVTRRPWKPLRQAYFYHAQIEKGKKVPGLMKDYPNVDIPKFLKMWDVHQIATSLDYGSEEIAKKVHNQRTFPVSTIERLYDDKGFRDYLGFDFNSEGSIQISARKEDFEKAFKVIVTDAVDRVIDTRKLGDEKDRRRYFEKISKPRTGKGPVTKVANFIAQSPPMQIKTPNHLAPKDIVSTLQSPAIERRLHELQTIPFKKFSNATHDLLRSFLELSLKKYLGNIGISPKLKGTKIFLEALLTAMGKKFQSESNVEMEQVVKVIKDSQWFLDAINHNPSVFSTPEKVKEQWDTIEPLIRHISK